MKEEIIDISSIPKKSYGRKSGRLKKILAKASKLEPGKAIKIQLETKRECANLQSNLYNAAKRDEDLFGPLKVVQRGLCVFVLKEAADAC